MRAFYCAVVLAVLLGCAGGQKSTLKPRTREELKTAVLGKSRGELLETLGKPSQTRGDGEEDVWVYKKISYDPVSERVDYYVTIRIDKRTEKVRSISP